jgi:hypothetical protein
MEIKGIEDPFKWSRDVVNRLQVDDHGGIFYSPDENRLPSFTSEGSPVKSFKVNNLGLFKYALEEYADYIINFIDNMNEVFQFGDDYGFYAPEVKYLSPEPLVNYHDLSLTTFPDVHFVGDALSARGITVSGAQGIYVAEKLIRKEALIDLMNTGN